MIVNTLDSKLINLENNLLKSNLINPEEYYAFSFLKDYDTKSTKTETVNKTLDLNSEIVSRVTTKGKVKFCNTDYIKATAYNQKEILQKTCANIMHPQMPKTIFVHVINELKKGNEVIAIMKHLDKKGETYWLNTNFDPNSSKKINIAFTSKSRPTSKNTIKKVEKIYNTLSRIESTVGELAAKKYFDGLLEMEYGNYNGFIIGCFE
jgi:transcriptional regulator with PAS, ATPase and Fis domain